MPLPRTALPLAYPLRVGKGVARLVRGGIELWRLGAAGPTVQIMGHEGDGGAQPFRRFIAGPFGPSQYALPQWPWEDNMAVEPNGHRREAKQARAIGPHSFALTLNIPALRWHRARRWRRVQRAKITGSAHFRISLKRGAIGRALLAKLNLDRKARRAQLLAPRLYDVKPAKLSAHALAKIDIRAQPRQSRRAHIMQSQRPHLARQALYLHINFLKARERLPIQRPLQYLCGHQSKHLYHPLKRSHIDRRIWRRALHVATVWGENLGGDIIFKSSRKSPWGGDF